MSILSYLSTTVVHVASADHYYAKFLAQRDALPDPIEEELEQVGNFLPLRSNSKKMILDVERRRRSGRTIRGYCEFDVLRRNLQDLYGLKLSTHGTDIGAEVEIDMTFEVGLTEKQRSERRKVTLPHYDAQDVPYIEKKIGEVGLHSSIEYQVDKNDDFDEDEDADEDLFL
jgi:elongator complex protein 5